MTVAEPLLTHRGWGQTDALGELTSFGIAVGEKTLGSLTECQQMMLGGVRSSRENKERTIPTR